MEQAGERLLMAALGAAIGIVIYAAVLREEQAPPPSPPVPTVAEVVVTLARTCPKAWRLTFEKGKLEGSCVAR